MKNNYPIKYAVMPIIEQTGWSLGMHHLVRDFNEVAYIVSKCYLINENKKYNKNGEVYITYEVVFPFEVTDYDWKKIEPQYNASEQCSNSVFVDKIFTTYEEAIEEAERKNHNLIYENTKYIPSIDKKTSKISECRAKLEFYKQLEHLIERNTCDLIVGEETKEQTVIIYGERNKKVNISLYQAVDLWDRENFKVYSLTPEEYEQVVIDLEKGFPLDKYNKRLLMINNCKQREIKIFNCDNSNNGYSLIDGKLQKSDESNSQHENFEDTQLIFYTLETYDDIIKSFAIKYTDDKLQLGDKILALRLKI